MAKSKDARAEDQAFVLDIKHRLGERRWLVERSWWGNILYHMGVQWVVYDTSARRWRMRKLSPAVPTPITNLFRATADTVKSVIAQHDPRFLATPERDDPHAVAAAANADATLQVLLQQGHFRRARRRMLDWLITTGNAFIEPVFDDSEDTGLVSIPYEHCDACSVETKASDIDEENPVCPECGGAAMSDSTTQFEQVPQGDIRMDVKSPFECYLDPAIEELEDQPIVLFVESYTTEQIYMRWNVDVEEDSSTMNTSNHLREAAATVASPGVGMVTAAQGGGFRQNRATVYRLYCKYHPKYKDGLYIAMTASGKELERKAPYPWKRKKNGRKFFPMVHFRFGTAPGRAWGYTPLDDLLPKQYQLNKAESLFTMIMAKMANPVWLIPSNSNPTRITGEIGIQIEYTPNGGQAPARVPGSEAPQSLVKYIMDIRQSFDELSGAFSAIRGRAIGTRTPVGTTQALIDRGYGRWATVFDCMEENYEDLAKNLLEIWRQSAAAPRVQAIKNALGGFTFKEFAQADWDDGVDISVEAGSTRPKTQAEKLQMYGQLLQAQLLDPLDQAQRIKILEDTGNIHLLVGAEEDTQEAYKENAKFMQWAQQIASTVMSGTHAGDPMMQQSVDQMLSLAPIMVHPVVDNHAVHFLSHRRLCLTDEFKNLPEQAQQFMFAHMTEHKLDIGQSAIMTPPPTPPVNAPPQKGSGGPSSPVPATKGA